MKWISPRAFTRSLKLTALAFVLPLGWTHADEPPRILADKEFFTKGSYIAFAGPWSVDIPNGETLKHEVDFVDQIAVRPGTFPANSDLSWHWPLKGPTHTGVYGYNSLSFGSYYGGAAEKPIPAKQVKDIGVLTEDFRFTMPLCLGEHNVLTEFFLAEKADGEKKIAEIGFFLHAGKSAMPYADAGEQLGIWKDAANRGWKVAKQAGPQGPYFMFIPVGAGDVLEGTIDFKAALEFLRGKKLVTGEEWFTGLALGIEPMRGSGSVHVESFAVKYE